jgi:preprotein translocase SecE subunit
MRIADYIKETRVELKHVSWPTRRQAIVYTIIVIIIALAVGALLGLFDFAFTSLLKVFI